MAGRRRGTAAAVDVLVRGSLGLRERQRIE
jgi:hypothetical protein